MGLLKNIEWTDDSKNTIVYKVDMKNDYISKGSVPVSYTHLDVYKRQI